jgi:hypothetical protein
MGEYKMKIEKKYLFNPETKNDFVYEIDEGYCYMNMNKDTIFFVEIPTDDGEFEQLEFKEDINASDTEGNTEVYAVRYSMSIGDFKKMSDKIMWCKNE